MTLLVKNLDTINRKIGRDPATDGILPFICCAPAFLIRLVPRRIGIESGRLVQTWRELYEFRQFGIGGP